MKLVNMTMLISILFAADTSLGGELSVATVLPVHAERDAYTPCVAFGKNAFLVAWQSGRVAPGDLREGLKFNGDIAGCRVGKNGKPLDAKPFVISQAKDLQEKPKAASNGEMFLVVWQDLRNGKDWDIYASRVSRQGKALDPDGILISGGAHNQAWPCVTWDGKTFVVAWQDFRSGKRYGIFAARVTVDGQLLDPQGILVNSPKKWGQRYTPVVASPSKGVSLIGWIGKDESGTDIVTDGKVSPGYCSSDRLPDDPHTSYERGVRIRARTAYAPMALASAGEAHGYFAVWTNRRTGGRGGFGSNKTKNSAMFLDGTGKPKKVLSTVGIRRRLIVNPDVCWDGSAFIVVWHEPVRTPRKASRRGIYDGAFFSRISPEGKVLGAVASLAGTLDAPAKEAVVASDGAGLSLMAYEQHPKTGDVPIKIGYRMLKR